MASTWTSSKSCVSDRSLTFATFVSYNYSLNHAILTLFFSIIAKAVLVYSTDLLQGIAHFCKRLSFIGNKEESDIHMFRESLAETAAITLRQIEVTTKMAQEPKWMSNEDMGGILQQLNILSSHSYISAVISRDGRTAPVVDERPKKGKKNKGLKSKKSKTR